jgi:hypothetical protein
MRAARVPVPVVVVVLLWVMCATAPPAQAQAAMAPHPMATPPGWMRETLRAEELAKAGKRLEAAAIYERYSETVPWFPAAHYARVQLLLEAGRADLVPGALTRARAAIPATAPMRREAAMFVLNIAEMVPTLPRAERVRLVAEAHALADEAMKADPRFGDALRMKASILTFEAEHLATDSARKAALTRQADALLERWFQLQK